jgi:hypothetical protein
MTDKEKIIIEQTTIPELVARGVVFLGPLISKHKDTEEFGNEAVKTILGACIVVQGTSNIDVLKSIAQFFKDCDIQEEAEKMRRAVALADLLKGLVRDSDE